MSEWVDVCGLDDIEEDDVIRFDHNGKTFAVCCDETGNIFILDGLCTHGQAHLADGLVMDGTIECPKHNGRFNIETGEAIRKPACVALKTHQTRIESGRIQIRVSP